MILIVDEFTEKGKRYQATGGAFEHFSHELQKIRDIGTPGRTCHSLK